MMAVLPLLFLFETAWPRLLLSLVIGGLVVYAHRENIVRLLHGNEKSWIKKKNEAP
jgi:glycerol-3-phosphate acyltransferase PlsY